MLTRPQTDNVKEIKLNSNVTKHNVSHQSYIQEKISHFSSKIINGGKQCNLTDLW
jgi:hypothetical protein